MQVGVELGHVAGEETAVVVTDSELNVLGDGVDIVIKPPDESLVDMNPIVIDMHTSSGLLDELAEGTTLAEAQAQVLAYVTEHVPEPRKAPLAGSSVYTDRGFLARDMPELDAHLHYRLVDVSIAQGAGSPLVPAGLLQRPRQARRAPRAGRHPRQHRRAQVLPRGAVRPGARPRQQCGQGDRQPLRQPGRPRRPVGPAQRVAGGPCASRYTRPSSLARTAAWWV